VVFVSLFDQILKWAPAVTLTGGFFAALTVSSLAVAAFRKMYGTFEVTRSLSYFLIVSLCFSAFAFGANDMANATGVFITPTEKLGGMPTMQVMFLLSLLGAAGIAIGGLIWGYRVLATSAYKVTRLDPLSGAAAEYSNAITVFLFTVVPTFLIGFGMPISTTHSSIGSIIGVGLAMRGLRGVNMKTTSKILAFWILTIPAVALISMSLFWLFSRMLGVA
jgi:phosphate/sulfate permease